MLGWKQFECLTPSFPILPVDWRRFVFHTLNDFLFPGLVSIDTT
jgi:hypothetical protein